MFIPRIIGWREWIALPELGVDSIKAKIDTGARSSALHAFSIKEFEREGSSWVSFEIHPQQRSMAGSVRVEHPVGGRRLVRSSDGAAQERPFIVTPIRLGDRTWPIELSLTNRDEMGFRMLLGRTAIRRRFLVHPGRSFLAGRQIKVTHLG